MTRIFPVLFRLALKNMVRWRGRLLLIALLTAFSILAFVVFGYQINRTQSDALQALEDPGSFPYDLLLILQEGQTLLPPEASLYHEVAWAETAAFLKAGSDVGAVQLLGVAPQSSFFAGVELQGREAVAAEEIVLPRELAEACGLQIGDTLELRSEGRDQAVSWHVGVVGIYTHQTPYPFVLTGYEGLLLHLPGGTANTQLWKLEAGKMTLDQLSELLTRTYPRALQLSGGLPRQLGESLLGQNQRAVGVLPPLLFLFLGISIVTAALITFQERRTELAELKLIGISDKQILGLYGLEYVFSGGIGLCSAGLALVLLGGFLGLDVLEYAALVRLYLQGVGGVTIVFVLAMVYPLLLAKAATVNQLMFSRTIPLMVYWINRMDLLRATEELTRREVMDNLRMVHIPFDGAVGSYDCLVFVDGGRRVKEGEVIASQELYGGHVINNFCSPCDGVILEMVGSLVVIKPDKPHLVPLYPYPSRPKIDPGVIAKKREQDRLYEWYSRVGR